MEREYKKVKLADIKPYENNPRKNDNAVETVRKSIEQVGYVSPIVVDEKMEILAGHTRYKALEELNEDEDEVLVVSGMTDENKRKFRLLDNKTDELADWDFDLLADELDGLDFGDIDLDWGSNTDGDSDVGNFSPSSFTYMEQYGVTVILSDEAEQEDCYNTLTAMGYNCRVVTT